MTAYIRALVAHAAGTPPTVEEIRLPVVGPGQVRVCIRAAGVCHSDLSMVDGTLRPPYPLILGHEAAGEVVEVGANVTRVAPGTPVALNWSPPCRNCWHCTHGEPWLCSAANVAATANGSTLDGAPVHVTLGLGAFAEQVVVPERAVIAVPDKVGWADAALLGCAVLTGTGAVRNTARVQPGDAVVVIGLGGVGLSVVAAARAAGAATVLAVDVSEAKKALAEAAGATEFLLAGDTLAKDVRARTEGRGADHAFECAGRAAAIKAAWRTTRRGGQVTVVGMGRADDLVELSALDIFTSARTLRASVYGSSDPDVELPLLAGEVVSGTLRLDHLVTDRITLAEVPEAFARMARGEGARSVVTF
ncbi:alcohol dehydrogenase catalytic domain-containing protein [Actinoplanes sp. NPDC051859]|uniref:alcohol dehydrogenase catalytic domain-containing protein n=1 Tax=Actinoplanes sp. NPDC051859 TaxID=3363909 RepID=UPI00378B6024